MRFCYLLFFVVLVGCTQKQPPLSSDKAVIVDTLIQKTPLKTPVARQELNWSNVLALMESLHEIPSDQRAITLKNIKAEAIKLNRQAWPKDWDTKPIRARFNVFVTHVSIAADQRLGDAALEEQSLAINKMKTSWDIFADLISGDIMLSGFNPTISQPIRKTE
jgi:hypothetical protein